MKTLVLTPEWQTRLKTHQAIVNKWIAGLRSDRWVQTTGGMTDLSVPNSACCLMVLEAECNNRKPEQFLWADTKGRTYGHSLPADLAGALKFGTFLPQNIEAVDDNGDARIPSVWNDTLGLTFHQIADLLENGKLSWEPTTPSLT